MIIKTIRLQDFRVFSGLHEINLTPKIKYGSKAPITLFGGLNGAGKTSILTAILLTLYGRHALEDSTSLKKYHANLSKLIHHSPTQLINSNSAFTEITFSFANKGIVKDFVIKRAWTQKNISVEEKLTITVEGKTLTDLDDRQAQAFINELIPIGIADLFFFDGEKIKSIAEDQGGTALAESIEKLLGLDVIRRLGADLDLLNKEKEKEQGQAEDQEKIRLLELELLEQEQIAETALEDYQNLKIQKIEKSQEHDRLSLELQTDGGAWSETREEVLRRQEDLLTHQRLIKEDMRTIISGGFPLLLMGKFTKKVARALKSESITRQELSFHKKAKILQGDLVEKLGVNRQDVLELIEETFAAHLTSPSQKAVIHDLTETQTASILEKLTNSQNLKTPLKQALEELNKTNSELDDLGISLARAPDKAALKSQFDRLKTIAEEIGALAESQKSALGERKAALYKGLTFARELKALHLKLSDKARGQRAYELAKTTKKVLTDFSQKLANSKIERLEQAFNNSFENLSRKTGRKLAAKIERDSYKVTLKDTNDNHIDRNDLSAGEKQIYAIAMLDALGKTTRRNLPIVIDTPLGRLDSVHRMRLAEDYFPHASQQVVILSTDTEIDNSFYNKLAPHISRAYRLDFDNSKNSSTVVEGYFWKDKQEGQG